MSEVCPTEPWLVHSAFYICRSHPISVEAEVGLAHPSLPRCWSQGTWDKQDFPASQACGYIHLPGSGQQPKRVSARRVIC